MIRTPLKMSVECPRCGASVGEPCRSVGTLLERGQQLLSVHRARRRALVVPHD
jgi:hypothetical protein